MIARYYRSDVGWCETCTGVDFGGVCSSINTKLETIRSQPHFWRNETDSAVFTQCHGNEKYTTCIGGWSHNQSQCQIGYDGVLCGTCSSEVDIYTVVEESTVDSGVNGTNVNFFFWTIGENFFFFFFWSISEQFPSF